MEDQKKIILFDGVCNLCSRAVQYIIKHDRRDVFRLASLQSEIGRQLMVDRNLDPDQITSLILIDPGTAYFIKSTAVLKIVREFGGLWKTVWFLEKLPLGFRDWVYDFVARNRYGRYGKTDECWMPTPELKAKFLE